MPSVKVREGVQPDTPSEGIALWATVATPSQASIVDDSGLNYLMGTVRSGVWTPALTFGGAAVGMTYSVQVGRWKKLNSLMIATCFIALSSKGSSTGTVRVTGLPDSGVNVTNFFQPCMIRLDSMASLSGAIQAYISPNTNTLKIEQLGTGTAAELTNANFTNTSAVILTAIYEA